MTRPSPLAWILPSLMWTAVILLFAVQAQKGGKALQAVEHWPEEATLEPIVIERDDPYPCLDDPLVRAACDRQGCVNRCEVGQ